MAISSVPQFDVSVIYFTPNAEPVLSVPVEGLEHDSRGESGALLSHSHSAEVFVGTARPCDPGEADGVGPSGAGAGAP